MDSLGLWEALALWFSGEPLDGHAVVGVPIHLVGRAGALLSLVGGLVVVLDLVGAQRLRGWGAALQTQPLRRLTRWVADRWLTGLAVFLVLCVIAGLITDSVRQAAGPILQPMDLWYTSHVTTWVDWAAVALLVATTYLGFRSHSAGRPWLARSLWFIAAALALGIYLPDLLSFFGTAIGFLLGGALVTLGLLLLGKVVDGLIFVLDPLIVRPIAWALAHETPGQPIRWAGFLILVVGQLLQLLTT